MGKLAGSWYNTTTLGSRNYVCGHCGGDITSNTGYHMANNGLAAVYVCHHCNRPTLLTSTDQVPAPMLGEKIDHLPKDIDDLYGEIRKATAAGAFTAVVLAARKLLMHVAVESGAPEGKKFITYVNYLSDNHYTPPGSKPWVDKIRSLGNEANHEIVIMGVEEAKTVIKFIEMILKFKYEFSHGFEDADEPTEEAA